MNHWIVWKVDDEKSPSGVLKADLVSAHTADEAFETYAREVLGSAKYDSQRLRAACCSTAVEAEIRISFRVMVKS